MSKSTKHNLKAAKDARSGGGFLPLTTLVLQSEQLANMTPHETKLLTDLMSQWQLGRNGDQYAAWTVMKKRGWRSKETLNNAIKGLLASGLIIRTRQGRFTSAACMVWDGWRLMCVMESWIFSLPTALFHVIGKNMTLQKITFPVRLTYLKGEKNTF